MNDTQIVLSNNLILQLNDPLDEFNILSGKAYCVIDQKNISHKLYGICGSSLHPFNLDNLDKLILLKTETMVKPVQFEIAILQNGQSIPVLVLERPLGGCIIKHDVQYFERWSEDHIIQYIVIPVFEALEKLHAIGLSHNGIYMQNLFYASENKGAIMLGCSAIARPKVLLPISSVMIEQSMCHIYGRGPGSISDDLFALGALVATCLLGHDPYLFYNDYNEFIIERATIGNYFSYIKNVQIGLAMSELLRGLLQDDREQWTLEDLSLWIRGRRRTINDIPNVQKAIRPFVFLGKQYTTARALAFAMDQDWDQAYSTIMTDGRLDVWLRHYLLDKEKVEAVKQAKETAISYKKQDVIVARVLMALDKSDIIRFRHFKCMIQGVGQLLAFCLHSNKMIESFIDIVKVNLLSYWFKFHKRHINTENVLLEASYKNMQHVFNSSDLGFGLERVVYDLAPGWPCLSPLFKNDYVINLRHLLFVLNRICKDSNNQPLDHIIDRHIAAFVLSKNTNYNRILVATLSFVSFSDIMIAFYAQVKIIAVLQSAYAPRKSLVYLSRMCAEFLIPFFEQFHNRKKRAQAIQKLYQIAERGMIQELIFIVKQYSNELMADQKGFRNAVLEYEKINNNIKKIKIEVQRKNNMMQTDGKKIAKIVAAGMFFSSFFMILVIYLS